jgi:hypothetical protein
VAGEHEAGGQREERAPKHRHVLHRHARGERGEPQPAAHLAGLQPGEGDGQQPLRLGVVEAHGEVQHRLQQQDLGQGVEGDEVGGVRQRDARPRHGGPEWHEKGRQRGEQGRQQAVRPDAVGDGRIGEARQGDGGGEGGVGVREVSDAEALDEEGAGRAAAEREPGAEDEEESQEIQGRTGLALGDEELRADGAAGRSPARGLRNLRNDVPPLAGPV